MNQQDSGHTAGVRQPEHLTTSDGRPANKFVAFRIGNFFLGEPVNVRVPPRVAESLKRQQDQGEILIGWCQLVMVSTFAVLYATAPTTFSEDALFEPVPWALGLYYIFTAGRLIASHRGRLPGAVVMVSIFLDMALLVGTIWSFHLQYGQEPGFSLKAPTMLYMFIFIALRALRFEPRDVVWAGSVAAVGWLSLLAYALLSGDMPEDRLTRDYVRYLTSSKILLGGEFDKVISILMVTAILGIVLLRAERLLIRSVTEHAAVTDLSRFFAPEVVDEIVQSEQMVDPGHGEIRNAAIMILDIRGFTAMAQKISANDVMALLAEYQGRMVPVIQRHGGSIDKFLGDEIMATFGVALKTETYAADALRAMLAILEEVDAWNSERKAYGKAAMEFGIGLAIGPVVYGAVGDASRLEYTVIGNAVNLSAKLEKHNKTEGSRAVTTADALALAVTQG